MELKVREELMQGEDGFDMGISGMTSKEKRAFWKDYRDGKIDRKELVDSLAGLFASGEEASTGGTYMDHYSKRYSKQWDEAHP